MKRENASIELSVVIPAWDAYVGECLSEAIASVRAQEIPTRIIVVDNASNAPVPERDGVEVVRSSHRLTVGGARNLGMSVVDTRWVILWDADDEMPSGTLRHLMDTAASRPGTVLVAGAIMDERLGRKHHWPRRGPLHLARWQRPFTVLQCTHSLFPTVGALMLTDAARAGGGFADADGGDDWALGISIAARGGVVVTETPGRVYRRHDGSVSAGWRAVPDITRNARVVRGRIRSDPALPEALKRALPIVALAQYAVIFLLRPLAWASRRIRSL